MKGGAATRLWRRWLLSLRALSRIKWFTGQSFLDEPGKIHKEHTSHAKKDSDGYRMTLMFVWYSDEDYQISRYGPFALNRWLVPETVAGMAIWLDAQAVSLGSLPQCAQVPVISGLGSTGCDTTDFSCVCQAVSFIQGVTASIQAACGQEDQQKTLALTKALCNRYGVTISVPDVAAPPAEAPATGDQAQPVPEAAQAAQAATSPSPAAGVESKAVDMAAAAVSTAPVSPNDDVSSSTTSNMDMGAMETAPPPSSSSTPLISYDTKSTIPSATIASATDVVRPQMSSPTMQTAYTNGTTNATVAASAPIPYVGAAASMAGNAQVAVMAMLAVVGMFWGL
ncbi:MAG: hypothetical protein Q9183_001488 [Haloplaca sp. 2 TL-2023]